ncbi:hypothetical protein F2P81_021212 [Scophthalmus maximus]|uniref:Glucagon / GIP / secretin / VIP family domain-containing protein n=1 Tax=Scophthalmus maximus TaxID=52904 RepID=A0A6A4S2K6_SCOMX|nr:hypothetical protein F2P81_021212 [Scophthalmus maximus]
MKQLQEPRKTKGSSQHISPSLFQTLNVKEHRLLTENSLMTEPIELPNMKRHSEGTFSNDYSKYLETRRAQDFVQWLKNSKRNGSLFRRHADGTYTSDVSSYLQDKAAKEFVSWLKTGRGRRD